MKKGGGVKVQIILIIIAVATLFIAVPKILEKEDQQHKEKENDNLSDLIDYDPPVFDNEDMSGSTRILSPEEVFRLSDQEIFARTLYGEGRNLPDDELEKIAWVIRNRVKDNGRENYLDTYGEVCLQKYQFSCWNSLYLGEYRDNNQTEVRKAYLSDQGSYSRCKIIAEKVITASELENPLENVQHYVLNNDDVKIDNNKITDSPYPDWVKNMEVVENDGKGSHVFLA